MKLLLGMGARVDLSMTGAEGTLIIETIFLTSMRPRDIEECSKLPESKVLEIVEALLKHNANINVESRDWTPLLLAVSRKSFKLVELLVNEGADVNLLAGSREGGPLKRAVEYEQKEMVELFLKKNANANLQTAKGITPLMVASNEVMASLLLKKGAKPDIQDHTGRCALFHMVERKWYGASGFLLRSGARYDILNDDRKTAEDILKERCDQLVSYICFASNTPPSNACIMCASFITAICTYLAKLSGIYIILCLCVIQTKQ